MMTRKGLSALAEALGDTYYEAGFDAEAATRHARETLHRVKASGQATPNADRDRFTSAVLARMLHRQGGPNL